MAGLSRLPSGARVIPARMALMQDWNVRAGESETVVSAENWLGALALALPALGMDLGAMGRLIIATDPDGTATARDPGVVWSCRSARWAPRSRPASPCPSRASRRSTPRSFASRRRRFPRRPAVAPEDETTLRPEPPAPSRTVDIHGPAREVVPRQADPLDDRLEDLFMRLGDINAAPTASDACASALSIAADLVRCDAGAVLLRTSAGNSSASAPPTAPRHGRCSTPRSPSIAASRASCGSSA